MILKSLILKNFRSYQDFKIDFDNKLNVIVGKNDIGKSTIFEALEIFFNNEKVKIEIEDLCVKCDKKEITIAAIFELEPDEKYTIDTIPTSLQDEYLLNINGFLEIHKVWDCSKEKITTTSLKQFIKAKYPKDFAEDALICLKNIDLKKLYKDYKDSVEQAGIEVRESTNSEMRQAIYKISDFAEFEEILIPIDKIDGKNVWSAISGDFPLFFLFQSDRTNKDTDKEVQDPLKAITKTVIEEIAEELENVKNQIEIRAKKIGEETIKKLAEMNPELASILKPDVTNRAWDSLFSFSFIGDDNIPMNKRGSGVRRLILLNYFRAEAERKNSTNKTIIYAIEEPETSQHPNHQLLLIDALCELANKEKCQVMITTHSPEIAKSCKKENLILIDKIDGKNQIINHDLKLKMIAETLGMTVYIGKLIICVEGENDRNFLLNINQSIHELNDIVNLTELKINIIPMNGSSLKNWIERYYLEGSNVIEFHLYDKDSDEKYKTSISNVNERNNGSFGVLTQRRELENYIHHSLYEKEFSINCSDKKNSWLEEDVPQFILNRQTRFPNKNKNTENIIKQIANGKLSKQMTKELFEDLGVFDEVKSWFEKIKEMYET
jgi:predicted ATP-dependent endonuclease of OLD family